MYSEISIQREDQVRAMSQRAPPFCRVTVLSGTAAVGGVSPVSRTVSRCACVTVAVASQSDTGHRQCRSRALRGMTCRLRYPCPRTRSCPGGPPQPSVSALCQCSFFYFSVVIDRNNSTLPSYLYLKTGTGGWFYV